MPKVRVSLCSNGGARQGQVVGSVLVEARFEAIVEVSDRPCHVIREGGGNAF